MAVKNDVAQPLETDIHLVFMRERRSWMKRIICWSICLIVGIYGAPGRCQELVYPSLIIRIYDAKTLGTIPWSNVALGSGSCKAFCGGDGGCTEETKWTNPDLGWYRAVSGMINLDRIGSGGTKILGYLPQPGAPAYSQVICIRLWKEGYTPTTFTRTIGPGENLFELLIAPAGPRKAQDESSGAETKPGHEMSHFGLKARAKAESKKNGNGSNQ